MKITNAFLFLEDITIGHILMFIVVLIGVWLVFTVIGKAAQKTQDAKDAACPVQKKLAKVIEKPQPAPNTVTLGNIMMVFEVEGGERLRLRAKAQNSLTVGDEGYLTWQGTKVLNFERTDVFKG